MPLFEVAVLAHPKKTEWSQDELEKLVYGPEYIVAKDKQHAHNVAVSKLDDKVALQKIEVLVRPFAVK